MNPTAFINIAKIVKTRAFPKAGVCFFKAQLFNSGSTTFQDCKNIFIRKTLDSEGRSCELAEKAKPLGGKWGQASAVALAFAESDGVEVGDIVAVVRETVTMSADELLLQDLLGAKIYDDQDVLAGKIVKIHHLGEQINLEIQSAQKTFEMPLQWLDLSDWQVGEKLIVPNWQELTELEEE